LLAAVPVPDPEYTRSRVEVRGKMPSPLDIPSGCRFHPRCPYAKTPCEENEQEEEPFGQYFLNTNRLLMKVSGVPVFLL